MRPYPKVLTEEETLDRLLAGDSIARFGDGELKLMCGGATATHAYSPALAAEYERILMNPPIGLLPAIPRPACVEKRWVSWPSQSARWAQKMDPARVYGSAFVGRTKVAPHIDTDAYRAKFRTLWRHRPVVAVFPPTHLLPRWLERDGADVVEELECPLTEAYAEIDNLEEACAFARSGQLLVVICGGPMATALAARLAGRGLQAIDLGRGSGFVWKG